MAHGRPDFSPTAVDVVLRPEWAAKEGIDLTFLLNLYCAAFGDSDTETYEVSPGKTLYICQVTAISIAYLAANAELPHPVSVSINDTTLGLNRFLEGGNYGFGISLAIPIRFAAGHTVDFFVVNRANHAVVAGANIYGYEV